LYLFTEVILPQTPLISATGHKLMLQSELNFKYSAYSCIQTM